MPKNIKPVLGANLEYMINLKSLEFPDAYEKYHAAEIDFQSKLDPSRIRNREYRERMYQEKFLRGKEYASVIRDYRNHIMFEHLKHIVSPDVCLIGKLQVDDEEIMDVDGQLDALIGYIQDLANSGTADDPDYHESDLDSKMHALNLEADIRAMIAVNRLECHNCLRKQCDKRDPNVPVEQVLERAKKFETELAEAREDIPESVTDTLEIEEKRELAPEQAEELLGTLKTRFESSKDDGLREKVNFADVERALRAAPEKLYALYKLEETGGEPELIGMEVDEFVFEDRCTESPSGRRKLDFERPLAQAEEFGVDMQSPEAYKAMQKTGEFDMETYSWLKTDPECGELLIGNRDGVVVYEVSARYWPGYVGWRASLKVKKV